MECFVLFYARDKNYNGIAIYLIDKNIDIYGNSNSKTYIYEHINIYN